MQRTRREQAAAEHLEQKEDERKEDERKENEWKEKEEEEDIETVVSQNVSRIRLATWQCGDHKACWYHC